MSARSRSGYQATRQSELAPSKKSTALHLPVCFEDGRPQGRTLSSPTDKRDTWAGVTSNDITLACGSDRSGKRQRALRDEDPLHSK